MVDHRATLSIDINSEFSITIPPVLEAATKHNNLTAVSYLIEQGVPVNGVNSMNGTALAEAAMQGYMSIVDYLLTHGANPNITRPGFEKDIVFSPLLSAIQHKHLVIAFRLLADGANPSPFDIKRLTTISKTNPYALFCLGLIAEKKGVEYHQEASAYYQAASAKGVKEASIREAELFQRSASLQESNLANEESTSDVSTPASPGLFTRAKKLKTKPIPGRKSVNPTGADEDEWLSDTKEDLSGKRKR